MIISGLEEEEEEGQEEEEEEEEEEEIQQLHDIDQIERTQTQAARFITGNHSTEPGTVTKLLEDMDLPSLQARIRRMSRLTLFHKLINGTVPGLQQTDFIPPNSKNKRQN